MGAYSPPFLDYIETTSVTTFPTTLFDALRGTSNWVPYIDSGVARRQRPAHGVPYLVLNSGVRAPARLRRAARPADPHRAVPRAVASWSGVLMVTAGHAGAVEGWFAGDVRDAARRGPVAAAQRAQVRRRAPAAARHRPGLRARPAASRGPDAGSGGPAPRVRPRSLAAANQVGRRRHGARWPSCGATLPALPGRITPAGATLGVPDYWQRDRRLARTTQPTTARRCWCRAPAFAELRVGRRRATSRMQSLADSRWAVRNVDPADPAGQHPDARRDRDAGWPRARARPGCTAMLCAGPGSATWWSATTCSASRRRPRPGAGAPGARAVAGLERVASFGPDVGGGATLERRLTRGSLVNGGWQDDLPGRGGLRGPRTRAGASVGRAPAGRRRRPGGPGRPRRPRPARRAARRCWPPMPTRTGRARAGAGDLVPDRRAAGARALLRPDPRRLLRRRHARRRPPVGQPDA